jgi:hypothetical protein
MGCMPACHGESFIPKDPVAVRRHDPRVGRIESRQMKLGAPEYSISGQVLRYLDTRKARKEYRRSERTRTHSVKTSLTMIRYILIVDYFLPNRRKLRPCTHSTVYKRAKPPNRTSARVGPHGLMTIVGFKTSRNPLKWTSTFTNPPTPRESLD